MHDAAHAGADGPDPAVPALMPAPEVPATARPRWTRRQLRVAVGVPVVCLLLVLALRLWLAWVGPIVGDRWALTRHDYGGSQAAWLLDLGNVFQVIGTAVPAVLTIAWAAVFVAREEGRRGVLFLGAAALGVVFNAVLKDLSGPTPLMAQRAPGGLNYPSGHVVYATVVFGALAWMAWRRRRVDIVAALVFLIVCMGPFRVTLGAHFPSDVVAAYLVGVAWLVPVAILTGYSGSRAPARPARPA
ncbi:MAG: phosphatase PAP2 family protein [Solirubrobacteraceae bacterium]